MTAIFLSLALDSSAVVGLLAFSGRHPMTSMGVISAIMGSGMAPIYSSILLYLEGYVTLSYITGIGNTGLKWNLFYTFPSEDIRSGSYLRALDHLLL